jgi:5-hydroxyisourate hydrolase
MTNLTTHVLDTSRGKPATGMKIILFKLIDNNLEKIIKVTTNKDGRIDERLLNKSDSKGIYEFHFFVGDYFEKYLEQLPDIKFLDEVIIRFGISDNTHYHVPLLVSPFGYSTYRGS